MSDWEPWTWDKWVDWRDTSNAPMAVWNIICRGTYPEGLTTLLDDAIADFNLYDANGNKTPEFAGQAPKVHKRFPLGKITMNRDEEITITPRWAETLSVDATSRNVTLQCKCRTDRGECRYRLVINLDTLLVILTQQTHPNIHLSLGDNPDRTEPRPLDHDFWPGEWFKDSLPPDEHAAYMAEQDKAIVAYRARRRTEIVVDRKGNITASL